MPKSAFKLHALENYLTKVVQNFFFLSLLFPARQVFSACFICSTATSNENAKEFRKLYEKFAT